MANKLLMSLIAKDKVYDSYCKCLEVWGDDFEVRMASMCITVTQVQGGSEFWAAALGMLCAENPEGVTQEESDLMDHTIRAAIMWHALELPDIKKALSCLEI
jgi:hypothetical protein